MALSSLSYTAWEPRAIAATSTTPVTLTAVVSGNPTTVRIQTLSGATFPLALVGPDTYQAAVPAETALAGYRQSTGHNTFGFLDVFDGSTRTLRINLSVNVRDAQMPDVEITPLSSSVQRSAHVVNVRRDTLWTTGSAPVDSVTGFYALMPDSFDFLTVISQVTTIRNRNYVGVRNNTQGIGVATFDNGAVWGSGQKLQGIVNYPIDSLFDMGETTASHEIGHRWANFLDHPSMALGTPHWPISDFARGIMGFSIPGSGAGGTQPFTFVEQANGTFLVQSSPLTGEFSELELYLMGLAPAENVPSGRVFLNQNQASELHNGGILQGPIDTVTIDEIIASDGPRVPAFGAAQTDFRAATIILSNGRLLTDEEMAFFDYMAARGEAQTELPYVSGLASGTTKPFYVATKGQGNLWTAVANDIARSKKSASVSEFGATDTFTVVLTAPPQSDVVLSVESGNASEVTVSPALLTFTPSNWRTPQTVTLMGVDDDLVDGSQVTTVTVSVVPDSSDNPYDRAAARSVSVTTTDNDTLPPSMDAIDDPAVISEDAPEQIVNLTGINAGGAESQSLEITAASNNEALIQNPFVDYSSPDATAALSYTPLPNQSGTADVTVTVRDAGFDGALGTADDRELQRTFKVRVAAVNDQPSFEVGVKHEVNQEAEDRDGLVTVQEWATQISPGSGDDEQLVDFLVSNDNNGLFSVQPDVDPSGTLTFDPAPNAQGVAQVTVRLKDNGGTLNDGVDSSQLTSFTIKIIKPLKWHNTARALDVSDQFGLGTDDQVVPGDALMIINYINAFGGGTIPEDAGFGPPYLDTTNAFGFPFGDNSVDPGDALSVINFINAFGPGLPGPEGEPSVAADSSLSSELLAAMIAEWSQFPRRRR